MMTWGIYLITNNVNDKKYVGMTNNLNRRLKKHWRELTNDNYNHHNEHLQNAVTKYGIENFEFFVLVESYPNEKLVADLEENYITKWHLDNPKYGYNKTKGGEHNIPNEEIRKKMSEAHKGKKHTEESKQKISKALKGKKHTEEHKRKIGEAIKGDKNGRWKDFARIIKNGFIRNGKQLYVIRFQGKNIKNSIDRNKLQKMANEINYCINMYGGV